MANVLQLDLIGYFLPVFSLLFIWVISYALLYKTKILGENNALNVIAATSVSVIFMVTAGATELVQEMIPWFILLVIVLILLFSIFMFLGLEKEFKEAIHPTVITWTVIVILGGIFLYSAAKVFGDPIQGIYVNQEGSGGTGLMGSIGKIIFHPKVLGAVFILIIAGQAVKLIVNSYKK